MGWIYYWIGIGILCLASCQISFIQALTLFGFAFIFRALVYGIEEASR